ncbi:hypothetical protein [Metamycoplasma hominis]|uniref:hypothetical protein n=1 Tax=Metamycoplasma hominis TaxID=2098 RepID=UPI001939969A|nr:hypothetical protein [Metamycoplasma hominis]
MKKSKLRILLSTSLIIALATTATLVATSLKSKFKRRQYEQEDNIDKLKEKFNRSKSKLDNLIKSNEAKDVDKQPETDIFNNTNLTNKDLIKDIESKTKTIEDAIESLTKKINDKKNQKDNLLKDFNDAKKQLQDLINSQDAQKVDTSKANQSLKNNNVDASSTSDQIINATNEIKKATQDLQKLIDAAKENVKQDFNSKKQQLDNLIKSNEAKEVDKQPETDIFNNTNLTNKDLIKDIESKTKTIEDALKSLTKKINDKKDNLLKDFNDAKKKLQDLINSQDAQNVDTSKANQSLKNNNVDASSTTDQIVNTTNEIKKATQDLQKLIDAAKENAKQEFNSKKQQLDDLIKSNEAKDVDKQQETNIFNNTNLTGNDLIKDIESKTKTIEDAIKSLTKKINDKKNSLLNDFNDAKKKLQDLIDSQDGQKVDTSKANQSLQNNNVDASSTTDQIINATNEIKKATQDLQKLIDAAKENAKQDFNSKKQQLDDLIKSNEAKDVDKQAETNIFNNTNLTGNDLIKDIESKTKTIEDAIKSLTKKINDKKPKENIEYDGLEKIREQIKQFIEKVKEDEYYKKYKNQQYYDWDSNIIDHLNRQLKFFENVTSASDIQQISAAKLQLTNDLKKAKKDKFSCDIYCFVNKEVTKFTGDMRTDSSNCLDSKKYWEEAEKEISKIREDALKLQGQGIQEDKLEKFKSDFRALKKPIEDKMNEILDEFAKFWTKLSNSKNKTSYFIENKLKGKAEYKEGYDALNKLIQEAKEILKNSGKHSNLELKNKEAEIQAKLLEYKNKYNMNK